MKKTNYRQYYVIINMLTMDIYLTNRKSKVAEITNTHRNTVSNIQPAKAITLNNYIVKLTTEQ